LGPRDIPVVACKASRHTDTADALAPRQHRAEADTEDMDNRSQALAPLGILGHTPPLHARGMHVVALAVAAAPRADALPREVSASQDLAGAGAVADAEVPGMVRAVFAVAGAQEPEARQFAVELEAPRFRLHRRPIER
jgi:hypothetical protein